MRLWRKHAYIAPGLCYLTMCGIAGIYHIKTLEPVREDLLKAMTDTLVHRGPDDEGFYCSGPVGLGHRRLSIIDLADGHQPMSQRRRDGMGCFQRRDLQFLDLHDELVKKGHTFQDTLRHRSHRSLYEEEGERCFERLRGMFAIAIWEDESVNSSWRAIGSARSRCFIFMMVRESRLPRR